MNKTGRLTIPASLRKLLRLEGEAEFEVEDMGEEGLILRPVVVMRREDAWAYTPDTLESIRRGIADIREGRIRPATDADFRALAEVAEE